jgi:exodeoxyribonuclease I
MSTAPHRFLWHDYETFGADAARDRPAQFAGVYTDADLNPVGEPLMFYCQPTLDVLPHPDATLITGITPQMAERDGLPEHEFAERIQAAFDGPNVCGVGYNSIRFDDEFTRHLFWRNFIDPYRREWFGGNSRWDLIDVVRLWHALRPEGLEWPVNDTGATSFKLEHLSQANGLTHERAHDALSDVYATLALAQKLKAAQPRLFAHALTLRDKRVAANMLKLGEPQPVLHVSQRIPASLGCISAVKPLAVHPVNRNCLICFDLRQDPNALLSLDVEELQDRLFTPAAELPEGVERLALKGIHCNKSPMLAPMGTLSAEAAERWQLDLPLIRAHHETLRAVGDALRDKVQAIFVQPDFEEQDAECALYAGFVSDADRARCEQVRKAGPVAAESFDGTFEDARLNTLLFRWRARHAHWSLNPAEQDEWQTFVRRKLTVDTGLASLTLEAYHHRIEEGLRVETDATRLRWLLDLKTWPRDSRLGELVDTV